MRETVATSGVTEQYGPRFTTCDAAATAGGPICGDTSDANVRLLLREFNIRVGEIYVPQTRVQINQPGTGEKNREARPPWPNW